MKKLLILMTLTLVGLTALEAREQKEKSTVVTTTFITDIDCESCERKILNSIPFQKGVSEVKINLPKKEVKVIYNSSRSSEELLIKAFNRIGVVAKPAEDKKQ